MAASVILLAAACSDDSGSGGDAAPPMQDNQAPSISGLMDQSLEADTPEQAVLFSVSDDNTAAADLAIAVTSDNQALVDDDGLVLTGEEGDLTLLVSPQPNQVGMVNLTVRVQDAMAESVEQRITLSIEPRQASFSSYLRTVFAADANSEPLPVNTVEFSFDGMDFDDLLQ